MPTYSTKDFQKIAAAIGVKLGAVNQSGNEFEAAAVWYRSDSRSPRRVPSSKTIAKAKQIAAAAKKLLRHLKISDYRNADDPGDWGLIEALASTRDGTQDAIIRATERIGRLAEIFEGIDAAAFLAREATDAAEDARRLSRLLPSGHLGETAENDWIAAMMSLYEKITGRTARTSVGAPSRSDEGKASGPLIRFLTAAGKPLGIRYSPESWRGRIRDNKTGGRRRK